MDLPPELETAICHDPEDRALRRVAVDWLSERGDPRGELIALALEHDTGNTAIADRLDALQAQLDPFTAHGWIVDWRWGYVRRAARFTFAGDEPQRAWRAFFASDAARFTHELSYPLASGLLHDMLLARPPCAVRALETDSGNRLDEVIAALPYLVRLRAQHVRTPLRSPVLRELTVSGYDYDWLAEVELPALERLQLRVPPADGAAFRFDVIERLPRLRELVVETDAVDEVAAALRGGYRLDRLERVEVTDTDITEQHRRRFVVDRTPRGDSAIGVLVVGADNTTVPQLAAGTLVTRSGPSVDLDVDKTVTTPTRLEQRDGRWYVAPYAAVNGAFVRLCEVRHRDVVRIGNTELVLLTHDVEASARELRALHGLPARRTRRR